MYKQTLTAKWLSIKSIHSRPFLSYRNTSAIYCSCTGYLVREVLAWLTECSDQVCDDKSLLSYTTENLEVLFHINSLQWIWATYNANPWIAMEWFRKPENKYQPMYYLIFFFNKQIFRGIWILTKLSEAATLSG